MTEQEIQVGNRVECEECGECGEITDSQDPIQDVQEFHTDGMDGFWVAHRSGKVACPDCREELAEE